MAGMAVNRHCYLVDPEIRLEIQQRHWKNDHFFERRYIFYKPSLWVFMLNFLNVAWWYHWILFVSLVSTPGDFRFSLPTIRIITYIYIHIYGIFFPITTSFGFDGPQTKKTNARRPALSLWRMEAGSKLATHSAGMDWSRSKRWMNM